MKTEDLISKYMESDQDEELSPFYDISRYFNNPDEDDDLDPIVEEDVDGLTKDQLMWIDIRTRGPRYVHKKQAFHHDDERRDRYQFIRNSLDKAINPFGGYLYKPFHYLGYNQTMGLLLPQGMVVDEVETYRAWRGMEMSPLYVMDKDDPFPTMLKELNLITYKNIKNRPSGHPEWGTFGWGYPSTRPMTQVRQYTADMWKHKYVILKGVSWDFSDQWIDTAYSALWRHVYGNLGRITIRTPYMKSKVAVYSEGKRIKTGEVFDLSKLDSKIDYIGPEGDQSIPIVKADYVVEQTSGSLYNITNYIGASYYTFNIQLMLDFFYFLAEAMRDASSLVVYPIFPAFGFSRTMPHEIIDYNWLAVQDIMDVFYKIPSKILRAIARNNERTAGMEDTGIFGQKDRDFYINYGNEPGDSSGSDPVTPVGRDPWDNPGVEE